MALIAECHPTRFVSCRGLCKSCYDKWLKTVNPGYRARQIQNTSNWFKRNPETRKVLNAARRVRELNDPLRYQKKRALLLKSKYGLSLEAYDTLLNNQNGSCAICSRKPGKRPLHVDHNHSTGKVRGLLCHQCNWYLGTVDRAPDILDRIKMYREAA